MKIKAVWGFAALAAVLWVFRDFTYGISFITRLGSMVCLVIAFIIWLTLPFKRPFAKKAAKSVLMFIAFCAIIGIVSFVWIEGLIFSSAKGKPIDNADVLVVLGAGLNGSTPSAVLSSRLDKAYDYLADHPGVVAILTGSQGVNEDVTEALAMKKYLVAKGIEQDRLILEEEAHNTAQNIKFSVELMEKMNLEGKVMVVSNEFHLYRAEKIFERFNIDAASLSAATPKIGLVPLNSYVREYCSIVVMGMKNMLGMDE
ncbi:MAG: YdcF family protein [Clostridiaceae bacterium]|nr:YdcF family protein [Clostridiaceae bacterium]